MPKLSFFLLDVLILSDLYEWKWIIITLLAHIISYRLCHKRMMKSAFTFMCLKPFTAYWMEHLILRFIHSSSSSSYWWLNQHLIHFFKKCCLWRYFIVILVVFLIFLKGMTRLWKYDHFLVFIHTISIYDWRIESINLDLFAVLFTKLREMMRLT